MSARFNIKAAEPEAVACLQRELHMPHFIAATLVSRGIDTPEAANRFLTPSLERDWRDPYIIPGLSEAADALEAAIRRGDHILVFGDFDLDGISATTVMTRGLREFGAHVTPFIPRRFEEGYAITLAEQVCAELDRKTGWVKGQVHNADGSVSGTTDHPADQLRIDAIREGEVPGIHTITYDSPADMIQITHSAHNRSGFALGAVLAAEFTATHEGLLSTDDLFKF